MRVRKDSGKSKTGLKKPVKANESVVKNSTVEVKSIAEVKQQIQKASVKPKSSLIWEEIENLPINMFAIEGQKVKDYVRQINMPGDSLYVKFLTSSALPALEESLGINSKNCKYELEMGEEYAVIKKVK